MKQTFTISLDEELVSKVRKFAREKKDVFRNKSHLAEFAIKKLLEENK